MRLGAARFAAALAAALVATLGAVPSAAQEDPVPQSVLVNVGSLPAALVPGVTERLSLSATVTNETDEPLRRVRVSLRFGEALRGRSDIASGQPLARLGTRVGDRLLGEGELAPHVPTAVGFDVDVADLPFARSTRHAVYPMRVELRARGELLGAADTYVMWWPDRDAPRLRVGWIWPLAERSHRALGNDFFDDGLLDAIEGPNGRLVKLLRIGGNARMPMTWAVDPELLDALRRMANGYTVRGQEGGGSGNAKAWLDRAKGATKGAHVLPLPYADADLEAAAALAPSAAVQTAPAVLLGREIVRRELDNPGDTRFAWPPGDTLRPTTEAMLRATGAQAFVLPEAALPLAEPLYYTPSAPTRLDTDALGSTTALLVDRQLTAAVSGTSQGRLDVQRYLADAAMISLERPNDLRAVVVAPPRDWDPLAEFATQLLDLTKAAPWVEPVTLPQVLTEERSTAPRTRTPGGAGILAPDQVRRVETARAAVGRLKGFFTDNDRAAPLYLDLEDALLRATSSRWGPDPAGGRRLTDAVTQAVETQFGRIRVVPGGVITMTGRSGRIPLTFQNDIGQTVKVRVRLDSRDRIALKDGESWRRGHEIPVPPGGSTLVLEGKARTGGLFPITVELLANDGTAIAKPLDLRVRSTAWGAVALVVTGVAFGLLLIASATRLLRRRRKAPAPAPATA